MAEVATAYRSPYFSLIDEILALRRLERGWDSYGADPVSEPAIVSAVELVHRFESLSTRVPSPEVGASPDGAVVLRWSMPPREIEIVYRDRFGEFHVTRRDRSEVILEGKVTAVDVLKDVIVDHVLGRQPLAP